MNYKFILFICWCFFSHLELKSQTNLITNPGFEDFTCTSQNNNSSCDFLGTCLVGWGHSHGTPNLDNVPCKKGNSQVKDHKVRLVCKSDRSEGVYTNVKLQEGCYKMYIRFRLNDFAPPTTGIPGLNLQVSLNKNIGFYDLNDISCQQPIPPAEKRKMIGNGTYFDMNIWHWISFNFDVGPDDLDLNQLMITGLSVNALQTDGFIDCINIFQECSGEDAIVFNDGPMPDGTYESCSFIDISTPSSSNIFVPIGFNEVELIANSYIHIKPNFRAVHNFRARIDQSCDNSLDNFIPNCCGNTVGLVGNGGDNELDQNEFRKASSAKDPPLIFPNPALSNFEITLPNEEFQIVIYDLMGNAVYSGEHANSLQVDASSWPKGIYIVETMNFNTNKKSSQKLIMQ